MALSEALAIERLAPVDVAGGLRLSDAAGWNQTAEDWSFFIAHGDAFGIRDRGGNGALVATAAALPMGTSSGWVSMVLVDEAHRHRGLATRLLGSAVDALRDSGRAAVLDATPAGAEVYRRVGFAAGFAFTRWQGHGDARDAAARQRPDDSAGARAVSDAAARRTLLALDRDASQLDRAALLSDFVGRATTRAWLARDDSGFALLRAGRRALQIGPVVAADEPPALALIEHALAHVSGAVFIDVPDRWLRIADALARRGFVRQRPFVRMALGASTLLQASDATFAVAGPEFG